MRKMTVILGLFVGGLCLADLATGQQGFGGGGMAGFGKGGAGITTLTLFNNASVKKELDVTDDQVAAVPEAVLKALGGVLNEKQFKRFKQIELQQRGEVAFSDAKIQEALKLTATQKDNVKTILDDNSKERKEILAAGGGAGGKGGKGGAGGFGGGGANVEKLDNLKKETLEKLTGLLTLDQKTSWKSLNGDTFKLEQPAFGGGAGGFGGKGGKKGKAAE